MKKNEALNYIRLHKGYVPYVAIFELFNDNDEIPQHFIDLSVKEDKPKKIQIFISKSINEI